MSQQGLIDQLSLKQRAVLELRLKAKRSETATRGIYPRQQTSAPLSFAQQRLWFLDQFEPESPLYNIATAVRMKGSLDVAALEQTLSEIVRRHEALRTTFTVSEGEPVQVIGAATPVRLPVTDLSDLDEETRETGARWLINEEAQTPFDLAAGPLLRASLLRLAADNHMVMLTMHHIVSDGWSMGVLVQEVVALYRAYTQGEESSLPELKIQYADYAAWQREWLQGEVLEQQLQYWREKLGGAPEVLELPSDFVRAASSTYEGAAEALFVPAKLTAALKELSRREGATLFMTLLAAFKTLLYRYSGQTDLVVGTPIANRTRGETEPLIGFFANTLALRSRLNGQQAFTELLQQVRATTLGGYQHQEVPFERIVEELQPERSLSHTPLFQVMLVLQNAELSDPELPGLRLSRVGHEGVTAKFDLTLNASETPRGIAIHTEYSTDLFRAETIKDLLGHFLILLQSIVDQPEQKLLALPMMDQDERQRVLVEYNQRVENYPRAACVQQLFEEQVAGNADAVALVCEDERLSYGELNQRANQLAHRLQALGVSDEDLVGVMLERSTDLIVSLLAVLKAGGVYLPLDPGYPQERLSFMISDAQPRVLITNAELAARFTLPATQSILLDHAEEQARINACATTNPTCHTRAESLAYVTYTSGSTGKPKGAGIPHRAVTRLVRQNKFCELGPNEVFLQLAPINFDASTLEVWGALCNGARLVVMSAGTASLAEIAGTVQREKVTTLWLTTALFQQMVATHGSELAGVRQLLTGGDVASLSAFNQHLERTGPNQTLVNAYGPTENTTFTTCRVFPGGTPLTQTNISIGSPINATQVYILDAEMQPVAEGVVGELYTGGDGLARGYLGRPSLTAEKFVPNSFGDERGSRLYRTGDMARWTTGGELEFIGRVDEQVKVRGFRIELGEVESALREHPAVNDAVVLAQTGDNDEKRLVAYVVSSSEQLSSSELRDHLRSRLPDYMLPGGFLQLDELPVTDNGKLDRRALPRIEYGGNEAEYENPRMPLEESLCEIWSEVLQIERIGIRDNFFELGGHSLLATQVVSRVRQMLGVELSLRALFEDPTVAGLARFVETAQREQSEATVPVMMPVDRAQPLPLSFAQQRLWFIDQLEPGTAAYNVSSAVRLGGALNIEAFARTFTEIVRRHETLRTTFSVMDGEPVQVIAEPPEFDLAIKDISELPNEEREVAAQRLAQAESQRPFDLATGPLLRVSLLRLAADEHVALLTMHHIVSDGWSVGVLVDEIATLYRAFAAGGESPLPELPLQYADYSAWQRGWLKGEVLEEQLGYWKQQLAGIPALLDLPTDRPRPAVQSFRGASQRFSFGKELSAAIQSLSRNENATLFMTLLAAFQALLHGYSRQEEIVVGSNIANRTRGETEGLIGFFVNNLVLRGSLKDEPTFRELIGRARETCLGAYAHQEAPFDKLVELLQPDRDASRHPLFQVMLVLQNAPQDELHLPGLRLSPVGRENKVSKFDLHLTLTEIDGELFGSFEYSTDLFDYSTINRMIGHLITLVTAATQEPNTCVAQLPLLTDAERQQQLVEFNATDLAYARDKSIHELFEAQATSTPDAVAVSCNGEELTYRELNERANQLAHYLRSFGAGSEMLIGLYVERSVEMLVGILGILKAGAAYVPLDLQHPLDRLHFLLEDAGVTMILTQETLADELPSHWAHVVMLDAEWDSIATCSRENPSLTNLPGNLAYVIYTSGSTGKPKGVHVSHRNLVHSTNSRFAYYQEPVTVFLLLSSFAFDSSVAGIFWTLCQGGCLVLPEPGVERDALQLGRLVGEHKVSHLLCLPSLHGLLLKHVNAEELSSLRAVIVAGEACPRELLGMHYGLLPEATLFNEYGPTEGTVWSTVATCDPDGPSATVSIGRAIPNMQTYVLDRRLNLVPLGVPGELYISGEGLARGYLNRPGITAERFIPHPYSVEPGARLYRTGDTARYLENGELEFIGRCDNQIKIRGYRIELGEIEAALRGLSGVRDAAVIARDSAAGGKSLVAYIVTGDVPAATLREQLRERLPDYMVPSAFVSLDELPLNANGKIDRAALPDPEQVSNSSSNSETTLTPIEELLISIWCDVLRLQGIGPRDNFFELGGHSLLATQVMSRIRETMGVEIPLRILFEAPTVEGLAREVEAARRGEAGLIAPQIETADRGGKLPLSFAQQRLWFLDQFEPGSALYNLPSAVRLQGPLDVEALERTLTEIVRRHEALRTTFAISDGEPVQVIGVATSVSLAVTDLSEHEDREVEALRYVRNEAQTPFDLAAGPLLRASLLRLSAEDHIVMLTMHHIVSDGWSMGVLVQEVVTLYRAYTQGEESSLPELKIQYADYAAWQRAWLQGEVLEQQLQYWREQLGGAPEVLELPSDYERGVTPRYKGAVEAVLVPAELTTAVKELSRREGATLFMTLLASFKTLLYRYTGQDDLVVGTGIANRTRGETERLIGFFVNTLALRSRLNGQMAFTELLQQVRATTLGGYQHQEVPFERIVEELQPERSLSHTPLFQVMFVLQNAEASELSLPGLSVSLIPQPAVTSKFDLMLVVAEGGGTMAIHAEYSTELFRAESIRKLLGHLQTLMQSIVDEPHAALNEMQFLTEEENSLVTETTDIEELTHDFAF